MVFINMSAVVQRMTVLNCESVLLYLYTLALHITVKKYKYFLKLKNSKFKECY